jgi:hypothetical protein
VTEQVATGQFDVHLYPVVRVKVAGITADSPQAAIQQALSQTDLYAACEAGGEFAEEVSHYLVDVVGDAEYEQSRWFHSTDVPLIDNLQRLVAWYDGGRDEAELARIIANARDVLTHSV